MAALFTSNNFTIVVFLDHFIQLPLYQIDTLKAVSLAFPLQKALQSTVPHICNNCSPSLGRPLMYRLYYKATSVPPWLYKTLELDQNNYSIIAPKNRMKHLF